jgi:hypothetical protein
MKLTNLNHYFIAIEMLPPTLDKIKQRRLEGAQKVQNPHVPQGNGLIEEIYWTISPSAPGNWSNRRAL